MNALELTLNSAEQTLALGESLGRLLDAGSIVLLDSDLGGGKTTLVQGIGRGLAIPEPILSPTFPLIEEYRSGRLPLYHMDLYRLEPAEVAALNLEDYWDASQTEPGIVAIEWAERLPQPPQGALSIQLTAAVDSQRQIRLIASTRQWQTVLSQLQETLH